MVDVRIKRRRELNLPYTPAIGWDSPDGHADDQPEVTGRAALVARYIAHALARDPGMAGWIRRHRLSEHSSQFSFWALDADARQLSAATSRIDPDPAPALLRSLVTTQLNQGRTQRANPVVTMFRAVESAAWGTSAQDTLGDETTLAAARDAGFDECVRRSLASARPVDPSAPATPATPAGTPDPDPWHGEIVMVDRPGEQCRVVLQFRLADQIDDAACGAVLANLLDGSDGLLARRLRTKAGLVYGTVAVARDDGRSQTLTIGASLLRERLPATLDALRGCIDAIDRGELPGEALAVAAGRVVDRILTKLDEPFGALDDQRRTLSGQESAGAVAERAPSTPARLEQPARLSWAYRPAVAYIGPVDDAVSELVGSMR